MQIIMLHCVVCLSAIQQVMVGSPDWDTALKPQVERLHAQIDCMPKEPAEIFAWVSNVECNPIYPGNMIAAPREDLPPTFNLRATGGGPASRE